MFLHVTDAKYLEGYKIKVSFNNGQEGIVDLVDNLEGSVFKSLRDILFFSQFKVDRELETITWPNGVDLAPEYLYFKAFKEKPGLQAQFKKWGYIN